MEKDKTINLVFSVDPSIEELAFAIVDNQEVNPLEMIKAIDLAVGDCSFTRGIFEYARLELEGDCADDGDEGTA